MEKQQRRKAVFVHIPKTGGSSINSWLKKHKKQYNFCYVTGHKNAKDLLENQPLAYRKLEPTVTFAVRRNTYERMMSVYNFLQHNFKHNKIFYGHGVPQKKHLKKVQEAHGKGIVYFTEWAQENTIPKYKHWYQPLGFWLKDVNFVLQFENLNSHFKIISDALAPPVMWYNKLDPPGPLKIFNQLSYYHRKSDLYTQDYVNVIQKYYGEEIEKYKYLPKKCLTS